MCGCPFKLFVDCLLTCGEECSAVRSPACEALVKNVFLVHDSFKSIESYEERRETLSVYVDAMMKRFGHPSALKSYFLEAYDNCRNEADRLQLLLCFIGHYVKLHPDMF